MKKLLNTLYVTSENSYQAFDGENIVVLEDQVRIYCAKLIYVLILRK